MLCKNWKGNIISSWSSMILPLLAVFINHVKETAFVILSMHIFVCSGSGGGYGRNQGATNAPDSKLFFCF